MYIPQRTKKSNDRPLKSSRKSLIHLGNNGSHPIGSSNSNIWTVEKGIDAQVLVVLWLLWEWLFEARLLVIWCIKGSYLMDNPSLLGGCLNANYIRMGYALWGRFESQRAHHNIEAFRGRHWTCRDEHHHLSYLQHLEIYTHATKVLLSVSLGEELEKKYF